MKYYSSLWFHLRLFSKKCFNTAIILYFLNEFVFDIYVLSGSSMEPTFNRGNNTIVLIDKITPLFRRGYNVNQIVSLKNPLDKSIKLCKRITGIAGHCKRMLSGEVVTIPFNNYWVEGDNKSLSLDSRMFGPVNRDFIIGRVCLQLFPEIKWKF